MNFTDLTNKLKKAFSDTSGKECSCGEGCDCSHDHNKKEGKGKCSCEKCDGSKGCVCNDEMCTCECCKDTSANSDKSHDCGCEVEHGANSAS